MTHNITETKPHNLTIGCSSRDALFKWRRLPQGQTDYPRNPLSSPADKHGLHWRNKQCTIISSSHLLASRFPGSRYPGPTNQTIRHQAPYSVPRLETSHPAEIITSPVQSCMNHTLQRSQINKLQVIRHKSQHVRIQYLANFCPVADLCPT